MTAGTWLDAASARQMLEAAGVPFASWSQVGDREAAAAAAAAIGWPVALKTAAADVVHKSDVGAVALGLTDADAVVRAYDRVSAAAGAAGSARPLDVIVERMAGGGTEMIVGLKRDPTFGAVLLVGLGGIWVEALRDIVLRLCPIDRQEAHRMFLELRGLSLLTGGRGRPPCDLDALAGLAAAVSRLGALRGDILELDLNPVMASAGGVLAVDARIRLDDQPGDDRRT